MSLLKYTTKILQEIGTDDYRSTNLFSKYMPMNEKFAKWKNFMDDINKLLNNINIVITL